MPKVTLSVPDALFEKMEKWKQDFNFSGVFQEAIQKAIEQKEGFKQRIQEDTDLETTIQRLKSERKSLQEECYNEGKENGLRWAKAAHYKELRYVGEADSEKIPDIVSNPTGDSVLGDYFTDIIKENDNFGIEQDGLVLYPNETFASWLDGWTDAVNSFWEEVKDKV